MKTKAIYYSIIIPAMLIVNFICACKTKEKTEAVQVVKKEIVAKPEFTTCDLMVTFISKGEGINHQLNLEFLSMVNDFKIDNQCSIDMEEYPWGREGEMDYCFNLKSLDEKLRSAFIGKVMSYGDVSDMIFVKKDVPNRHLE